MRYHDAVKMPKKYKLKDAEIAVLVAWVSAGRALADRDRRSEDSSGRRRHQSRRAGVLVVPAGRGPAGGARRQGFRMV